MTHRLWLVSRQPALALNLITHLAAVANAHMPKVGISGPGASHSNDPQPTHGWAWLTFRASKELFFTVPSLAHGLTARFSLPYRIHDAHYL
jgi:hypothetical protein